MASPLSIDTSFIGEFQEIPSTRDLTTDYAQYTFTNSSQLLPVPGGPPASFLAQVALCVVIAILWFWSAIGNLLTILVISKNYHMRNQSNFFILSLAVSDLLSGTIASPLWVYRRTFGFYEWEWGSFLCKLFWFTDESTSYCTAMHIASFAVWRYIGVKWPFFQAKVRKRSVKIWLSSMWVLALVFGGAAFSSYYAVQDRAVAGREYAKWPSCTINTKNNGVQEQLVYYTFSSTTFMLLPMFLLFVASLLILVELFCTSQAKGRLRKKKERRAACQLALIASSFLFGYIPMTVYVMWTTRTSSAPSLDYWTHVGAYFALRTSECLNPIIYNIASKSMRRASAKILYRARSCCVSAVAFVGRKAVYRLDHRQPYIRRQRYSVNSVDSESMHRSGSSGSVRMKLMAAYGRKHLGAEGSSSM